MSQFPFVQPSIFSNVQSFGKSVQVILAAIVPAHYRAACGYPATSVILVFHHQIHRSSILRRRVRSSPQFARSYRRRHWIHADERRHTDPIIFFTIIRASGFNLYLLDSVLIGYWKSVTKITVFRIFFVLIWARIRVRFRNIRRRIYQNRICIRCIWKYFHDRFRSWKFAEECSTKHFIN